MFNSKLNRRIDNLEEQLADVRDRFWQMYSAMHTAGFVLKDKEVISAHWVKKDEDPDRNEF
jgi:hypothetical protein